MSVQEQQDKQLGLDQQPHSRITDISKKLAEISPEQVREDPETLGMLLSLLLELAEIRDNLELLKEQLELNLKTSELEWELYELAHQRQQEIEQRIYGLIRLEVLNRDLLELSDPERDSEDEAQEEDEDPPEETVTNDE